MKANKIIALLVAIVLTFAITSPAEAQFGNLLNKAKNSVQKKIEQGVKDRAERAAERAVDNAIDKAEQHVEKEASKAVKKASKKVAKKTGVNVVESSSSSSPIDEDDALRLLHVLQAAAQSFQMSDVDVPAMAQMDTELLLHVCKKSRKLLHKPAAVLLDALLPDEAVPIGDGLDLSSVHKEVLK